MHQIVVIRVDGIGLEIAEAAVRVVEATGVPVQCREVTPGQSAVPRYGEPVVARSLGVFDICHSADLG
jgi:isocitrate dehydrogenase (NAD+)